MSVITPVSRRRVLAGLATAPLLSGGIARAGRRPHLVLGAFSRTIGNTAYEIARRRGWFEAHPALANLNLQFMEFEARSTIQAAFERGGLDILFSADTPSLLIRADGADVDVRGPLTLARQDVLVRRDSGIDALAGLEGARVGVQDRTSSHHAFLRMLRDARMESDDVRLIRIDNPQGRAAFEAGELDAWITWSPWMEPQELSGRGRVIARGETGMYNVATIARRLMHEQPETVSAVMEVIAHTTEWVRRNTGEAKAFAAGFLNLEPALINHVWPKIEWGPTDMAAFTNDLVDKAVFLAKPVG